MSDITGENSKKLEWDDSFSSSFSERIMLVLDGIMMESYSVKIVKALKNKISLHSKI